MATTYNLTKSGRRENLTSLSGSVALSVNAVDGLDQIVSAGTEEEAAMGAFVDHQLQAMVLRCDVDATAQFLGDRYAILATAIAGPDTITHTGDLTQEIFPGDIIRVEDTVGDDGYYLVETVVEAIGVTTLTLALGQVLPAGAGGAVGTLARVCTHAELSYKYAVVTVTAATGAITFTGDLSDKFVAGDTIKICDSTGNNGIWEVVTVTYVGATTTIVVQDINDAGLLPDNTDDGTFALTRTSIDLAANSPYVWDINQGTPNPFFPKWRPAAAAAVVNSAYGAFRGNVVHCLVTVPGAVNGQFNGDISKNPELP